MRVLSPRSYGYGPGKPPLLPQRALSMIEGRRGRLWNRGRSAR